MEVADDRWYDCQNSKYDIERDPVWEQKYIEMTTESGRERLLFHGR